MGWGKSQKTNLNHRLLKAIGFCALLALLSACSTNAVFDVLLGSTQENSNLLESGNTYKFELRQWAMGSEHLCALFDWLTYDSTGNLIAATKKMHCAGSSAVGQLGLGATSQAETFAELSLTWGQRIKGIATGLKHTCVVLRANSATTSDEIYCWGDNTYGQVTPQNLTNTMYDSPQAVSLSAIHAQTTAGYRNIVAGSNHTCVIVDLSPINTAGGGRAVCWGKNTHGQVGSPTPTTTGILTEAGGTLTGLVQLAAGEEHTCAVQDTGRVYCLGRHNEGQLGNNTALAPALPYRASAVKLSDDSALVAVNDSITENTNIASGISHTCAIAMIAGERGLYCWGSNSTGQLGYRHLTLSDDPPEFINIPYLPGAFLDRSYAALPMINRDTGTEFTGVATIHSGPGANHNCFTRGLTSKRLYCWGNIFGSPILAIPESANTSNSAFVDICDVGHCVPSPIRPEDSGGPSILDTEQITIGENSTCAWIDFRYACWGTNTEGKFGNPNESSPGNQETTLINTLLPWDSALMLAP